MKIQGGTSPHRTDVLGTTFLFLLRSKKYDTAVNDTAFDFGCNDFYLCDGYVNTASVVSIGFHMILAKNPTIFIWFKITLSANRN